MIKFEVGQVYSNKTKTYLGSLFYDSPAWIKDYLLKQKKTVNGIKYININGIFRGDFEYKDATKDEHRHLIFVLVDINGEWLESKKQYKDIREGRMIFREFLKNFRKNKKHGHWDYVYGDLHHSNKHVFVFNMSSWAKSIEAFDEGKYSKMFTQKELTSLGITKTVNGQIRDAWYVLTGDKNAKEVFKNKIQQQFGTILKDKDVEHIEELDTPPLKRFEYLNGN